MDDRLTLCNLSVETGAKTGMFYADDITVRYLAAAGQKAGPQVPEPCTYTPGTGVSILPISSRWSRSPTGWTR